MPELPEVETVRRGLAPVLTGARIVRVDQRRPDLRFPFPDNLAARLEGAVIETVGRRAKFLTVPLDTGETLVAHLGMTGRFSIEGQGRRIEPGAFYAPQPPAGHEHLVLDLDAASGGRVRVTFSDPRRFGFMELHRTAILETLPRYRDLGPEPLGPAFTPQSLLAAGRGRSAPLKAFLLDQKTVAGLGNIYVCEALFLARLSPRRQARTLGRGRAERLTGAIRQVLAEAIDAGGSTLRDYAGADGRQGAFQQSFRVYDRAGEPCVSCSRPVSRIVQSGRSTFFCPACQR